MNDAVWAELAALSDAIDRLTLERRRCTVDSPHRQRLETEIDAAERRRAEIVAILADLVPAGIAAADCA